MLLTCRSVNVAVTSRVPNTAMKSNRATHDFVRFVNVNSPLCNGFHLQFNYSKLHIFVNLYLLSLLHFISYNVAGGRFMRGQEKTCRAQYRHNPLKYIASPVIMLYNIEYISIIGNPAVWSDFSYDGVS